MFANLSNAPVAQINSKDSIVIRDNFQSIRGGSTLGVAGFTPEVIQAGHVVIRETSTGDYKPMPIASASTYAALPALHTYAGVVVATIKTSKPFAGIMVRGTINPIAAPYDFATIAVAFRAALPLIDQRAD